MKMNWVACSLRVQASFLCRYWSRDLSEVPRTFCSICWCFSVFAWCTEQCLSPWNNTAEFFRISKCVYQHSQLLLQIIVCKPRSYVVHLLYTQQVDLTWSLLPLHGETFQACHKYFWKVFCSDRLKHFCGVRMILSMFRKIYTIICTQKHYYAWYLWNRKYTTNIVLYISSVYVVPCGCISSAKLACMTGQVGLCILCERLVWRGQALHVCRDIILRQT